MSYCNVGSGATELSDLGSTVLRLEQLIHKLKYRYLQFSSLNCVTITCTRGDLNNSGLADAILNLSLSVRSDSIVRIIVGLLDPENIRLVVGIKLLSCVPVKI